MHTIVCDVSGLKDRELLHNWVIEKFENINMLPVRRRISSMRAGIILMSLSIQ